MENLIDREESEFSDQVGLIDNRSCNTYISESSLRNLLEKNFLNEDLVDMSSLLIRNNWD